MCKCKKKIFRRGRVVPDFPVDGHIFFSVFFFVAVVVVVVVVVVPVPYSNIKSSQGLLISRLI